MTPSFSGRTATMFAGVRPTMRLASAPTARIRLVRGFMATTEGSLMTIPLPRTSTSVFAVPRSIPMSRDRSPKSELNGLAVIRSAACPCRIPIPFPADFARASGHRDRSQYDPAAQPEEDLQPVAPRELAQRLRLMVRGRRWGGYEPRSCWRPDAAPLL